eukprot:730067-Hanusia_phi.AAC.1
MIIAVHPCPVCRGDVLEADWDGGHGLEAKGAVQHRDGEAVERGVDGVWKVTIFGGERCTKQWEITLVTQETDK